MNPNDVIEAHVRDVMQRLPRAERSDIGLELRELLNEMLADRAASTGLAADEAMALALLREFGSPEEVAARYRSPGLLIIPADQTRRFALWSLIGIGLQWAITLPRVFQGQPVSAWWFSWGLGALWWPGFLVMMALAAAWVRTWGLTRPAWRPRHVERTQVHRGMTAFTLACMLVGMAFVICMPWIATHLPEPMAQVFAFDPEFLSVRAWPVLVLYLADALMRVVVLYKGRWSARLRHADLATSVVWVAVLAWWMASGNIFVAAATDVGAKFGIGLVVLAVLLDLVVKLYRMRLRLPAS